ncbi:MAG: T9SS type A sorting domain-containing protein [Bacteroidia bacterium]
MKKQVLHLQKSSLKLLNLVVLSLFSLGVWAQSSTTPMFINTNTTGGCNSFPFNNTGTSRKVQFMYTAGEFTGAPGGAINRIWIRPCTGVTGTVYSNFSIRMRQEPASVTTFGSGTFLTPVQTCLSASTYSFTTTANNWYPIPLTTPFVYDPTKTLIIEIEHQSYSGTGFTINQSGSGTGNRRIWGDYQSTAGTAGTAYANMGIDVVSLGNNDIGVSSIDSPGVFCAPNQNIWATVKNFGKNQVTGFNVHWSINGVAQSTIPSFATLDTMGGSGPNTIQIQLGNHTFSTTSITTLKAWTSQPNGQADTVRINDSSTVTKIPAFPGGTYTIGGSGANFATIDAAVSAMVTGGICGPVVFNITPGTYTRTTPLTIPDIQGTSPVNTITFDGGNPSTTIFTGAVSSSAMFLFNATKYLTFKNITVTNTSATAPGGIGVIGSTRRINIINCRVNVPIQSGTSTTGYGITITGTASGVGVSACSADSIVLDSNIITGGGYSIVAYGSSNVTANRGLVFTNNIINNCNYMGGYIAYNYNPIIFDNNTINMQGGAYGYYGLYYYYNYATHTTISHSLRNNKIYNFGGYGMYIYYPTQTSTTAKLIVYNNVLSSATGGSYYGYYGIYIGTPSGTYNAEVYHNTVAMNGNSTSTSYSAFYSTGSTSIIVKNNIFAVYGGSYTPAYFATNPTGNVVNYNLYWNASNPLTGSLIYRNGSFFGPSAYKTAANGGDSSFNSNPSFVNRLATPSNLALTDGCDGLGVNLTAFVPTDINGTTRSTTPTLGAYEFSGGTNNNLAVLSILTPVPPITTGAQDLRFLVKNVGSNTVTSYNASYRLNNGTPVTILMSNTLATCATDTPTFTGTNQINLTATNNIVCYTDGPNFSLDADRSNDTVKATMLAPLSGTYTVGGSNPDFTTLQDAVAAMANGVGGNVIFDIRPGTYTGQVKITGPIPGLTGSRTVTFEGNDAATRIITANTVEAAFLMINVKNVRVRNLTINNTNTGNCGGIGAVGSSANDDCSGIQIVKCRVNLTIQTSTNTNGWGINFTSQSTGVSTGAMGGDSILIDSNIITGGAYGITVYGASNDLRNRGIVITNNKINNNNYMGAYVAYNYNPIIFTGNEINMQGQNYGYYGLYHYYNYHNVTSLGHKINNNIIRGFGGYGMYIYYPQNSTSAGKTDIYNNLVVNHSNGGSYPGYYAIYLGSPSGVRRVEAYHNTVIMLGTGSSTSYTAFYNTGTTELHLKNNIFVTGSGYTPVYLATNPTGNIVNYNIYYNTGSPTSGSLIYRNGTFFTPSNYKTTNAGGDSSWNFMPSFVSSTNYDITEGCTRGVNLTSFVPQDILGRNRSTAPNPGAYEYPGTTLDITPAQILTPSFPVSLGTQDLRVLVRNNGTTTVTFFEIAYRLNNGNPVTTAFTGTLASCDTVSILFTGSNAINLTNQNNTLRVYTYNVNLSTDLNPNNDTLDTQLNTPMTGSYTIGATSSDFNSFTSALNALTTRGASGEVIFNVRTGVYNEQVNIGNYPGNNLPGTMVWFKSMANHRDSVRLQWNSISGANYVVRFNNASRVGFRDMWIAQLAGNTTCYNLLYDGTNNFDSIHNCRISVPVYGVNGTSSTYTIYVNTGSGNGLSWTNNRIVGSYFGNYIYGSSSMPLENPNFSGNTVDSIYYSPMYYLYYTRFAKINNNTFLQRNLGSTCYLYWYYNDSSAQFRNNRFDISAPGYYHYLYYWRNNTGYKGIIANNTYVGNASTMYLYWGGYSQNLGFYHNTFSTNSTGGYAPYFYNISSTNIDVANNVCQNYSTGHAAGFYQNVGITSDNNSYFTNGSNLIYRGTPAGSFASLPLWKAAAPGLDSNSIQYRPGLTANMNPIPNVNDTAVWSIHARGKFLTDVTTDINGNPRSTSNATGAPDLGAFEFFPTSLPPLCTPVPAVPAAGITQAFLFGTDTVCTVEYDQFALAPASLSVRQYTGTVPPQIGSATNYPTFYVSAQAPAGFYGFNFNLRYKDNWIGTITSEADLKLAHKTTTNPWMVYQFTSTVNTIRNNINSTFMNDFGLMTGADNNSPLPVKLTRFVGVKDQNNAILNWQTATERNSSHFVVERSFDRNRFEPISRVTAAGNSDALRSYNFTDAGVFNRSVNVVYYRLNMVDRDGSKEYSNIVAIRNNAVERNIASIHPNPFVNEFNVEFAEKGDYHIEVFDVTGKLMFAKNLVDVTETNIDEISGFKSGVYFVNINNTQTIKVLKQ